MGADSFKPINSLEECLLDAQSGKQLFSEFIQVLLNSKLYLPSIRAVSTTSIQLYPVIFDRNGLRMASVFTDYKRINRSQSEIKGVVEICGCDLFKQIPSGIGVVINPGYDVGMELLPHGIKNIITDFLGGNNTLQ